VVAALVAAAALLASAPPAQAAHHPRPAPGPVVHEPGGVTIHYYAHPVGPVPMNATSADGYSLTGSEVYLVCPSYLNTHCAGFLDTLIGAGGLVIGIIGVLCEAKVIDCPGIWKKISKGTGRHTGLVTFENEGEYGGVVNPNYDLHDCIGAAPNASDGNDRAYLSHPSRCFGVSYQSWKYQQDGSKPIYRFVNRFAELTYGRTDVLTLLSKRDGAFLYAKTATALPSGAYAHWSIYAVGTCNPC